MSITRRKRRNKRAFTLLELFICLMILSIAGGAMSWQVKGLYDHHQLNAAGRMLTTRLQELQLLALSYQTEMKLELITGKEGILYRMISDEPLLGFDRAQKMLGKDCEFKMKQNNQLKKTESQVFTIDAMGRIEPRCTLELRRREAKAEQPTLLIDLSTPLLIKSKTKKISVP